MWKSLSTSQRVLLRLINSQNNKRTFLSEAYRCTDAWNERLQSPLLSKVNSNELFVELDQKFQTAGKASAVDVDIYMNVIAGAEHNDELIDILHKLRLTTETSNTLDSTHHAVIRFLLDNNEIDDLFTVLYDRINYGIFPDHLCYNILMDTFLKKEDVTSAARIAVLLMLQEDSEHPICNALALYSSFKYLEKPGDSWKAPEPEPEDTGEVIKVRVQFIRNPYFDDHFDLVEPTELVGKTLVFYGKKMDNVLGRSCHLQGLTLWKKYKEAVDLIKDWETKGQKECIYKEAFDQIQTILSGIPEDKVTDEIKELKTVLEGFNKSSLKEGSILEECKKRVEEAVEKQAATDITDQLQRYKEWENTRMSVLQKQLDDLDKKTRLEKVEEMKEDLVKRERLLTFFRQKSKLELQIYEKLAHENKIYGKKIRSSEDIEDNYVPPEVIKKRG